MALASFALTTLEAVKQELPTATTTDDTRLERRINAASRMIIEYTGREFKPLSMSNTRVFPVYGGTVRFNGMEARAITQIRANVEGTSPVILTSTDYQLAPSDITTGGGWTSLTLLSGYTTPTTLGQTGLVEISGTWGWQSVPEDVEMLCIAQVVNWLRGDLYNRTDMSDQTETFTPSPGLSPAIRRALDVWRVPAVA